MSGAPSREEERLVRAAVRRHLGAETRGVRKQVGRAGRQVFFVELEDREVVLKVLNARKARAVSCEFAAEGLRRAGVPTPLVLAVDRSGRYEGEFFEYPFLIMERAEGVPMDRWLLERKPERRLRAELLRRVGEHLRRIHSVQPPTGWGTLNDQGVGRFDSWREYLVEQRVRRADGELARTLDTRWLEAAGLLSAERRSELEELMGPEGFDDPSEARLVHNDLTLKNIFVDPASLEVTAILDLHNALAGDPALDLARFVYFYRGRGHYSALRAGYGEIEAGLEKRGLHLLVFVLLEKITWLKGREDRFPGRMERDLQLLERTVKTLSAAAERDGA